MTIIELKDLIKDLPDEMEIILQKDAEGNGYSPLEGADSDAVYEPEDTWSGEVYDTKWSANDADMDEEDWEQIKSRPHVLVLYPIN